MGTQGHNFYRGWLIAATATLGLTFSFPSIAIVTFGAFIGPLQAEFGWQVVEISFAMSFCTIATIVSSPAIGMLIDRWGVKRVILISTVLLGLLLVAMGWVVSSLFTYYLAFALIPIAGGGAAGIGYSKVVISWFSRRQGTALGLALAGVGIGAIVSPIYAQYFISNFGWRTAYVALGVPLLVLCFPAVLVFLRVSPSISEREQGGEFEASSTGMGASDEEMSLTLGQASKTGEFRLLFVFLFCYRHSYHRNNSSFYSDAFSAGPWHV